MASLARRARCPQVGTIARLPASTRPFASTSSWLQRKERLHPEPEVPSFEVPPSILLHPKHPFIQTTVAPPEPLASEESTEGAQGDAVDQIFKSARDIRGRVVVKVAPGQDAEAVREEGRRVVEQVLTYWTEEELNVQGTMTHGTMRLFARYMMHPLVLAPMAHTQLKLLPDRDPSDDRPPLKPSRLTPVTLKPICKPEDHELTDLLYLYIGGISLSLPVYDRSAPHPQLKDFLIALFCSIGPPVASSNQDRFESVHSKSKATAAAMMQRAYAMSGQLGAYERRSRSARAGNLKPLLPELKCAQLGIFGAAREARIAPGPTRRLKKHHKKQEHKFALLRQRWMDEERALIPWRRRLVLVEAFAKADAEAREQYRLKAQARLEAIGEEIEAERGPIPGISMTHPSRPPALPEVAKPPKRLPVATLPGRRAAPSTQHERIVW